jgi:type II secretory pathway component PulL
MGNLIRQWGMVAGLALLASVFYLVSVGVDSYHLSKERDQLDASMKNLYQQIFSEEVEDRPADRMRKKLIALGGKSQGADNFISVMLATGKEFLADKESSISRLRYTGNSMEVDLVTGTIEQLEKLQQQIASDTTRVQLKAVTNDNGKVRGRLVVSQGGGQS